MLGFRENRHWLGWVAGSSRQVAGRQKVGRWAGVEGVSRWTEYGQNAEIGLKRSSFINEKTENKF